MESGYFKQAALLVRILPAIFQEKDIALHGGTAINLFHYGIPRLSVDIDLTFIPLDERAQALRKIEDILQRLKQHLTKTIPGIRVVGPKTGMDEYKLFCSLHGNEIKVEVNLVNRGLIMSPDIMPLSSHAQETFNAYCEGRVVHVSQLFGGKMVASLDRQHPRDLFDMRNILERHEFSDDLVKGFIFCLLSSKRPFHEILDPTLLDQRSVLNSQFSGMTDMEFPYEKFESTRLMLIEKVRKLFTPDMAAALINFADSNPDWVAFPFQQFPGIQWKLKNIEKLKKQNPAKHREQLVKLKRLFGL